MERKREERQKDRKSAREKETKRVGARECEREVCVRFSHTTTVQRNLLSNLS